MTGIPQQSQEQLAPTPEQLSELLPGYDVTKIVGIGGMGAVYHARQSFFNRDVAIKLVLGHAAQDAELIRQFHAEAQSMSVLNHEYLIGIYDYGQIDGMPYIIMEFVPGSSLYEAIAGHPIEPLQAAEITLHVCEGLGHAHELGILHRDIKPENIMLAPPCTPKIADFGLARDQHDPTQETMIWGSPGYVAPEVVQAPHLVDQRSDVYSVGCVLYACLTGEPPNPNMLDTSKLMWCDHRFSYIISKAMHYLQETRYQNCEEMAHDLRLLIESLKRHNSTGATPYAAGVQTITPEQYAQMQLAASQQLETPPDSPELDAPTHI